MVVVSMDTVSGSRTLAKGPEMQPDSVEGLEGAVVQSLGKLRRLFVIYRY